MIRLSYWNYRMHQLHHKKQCAYA